MSELSSLTRHVAASRCMVTRLVVNSRLGSLPLGRRFNSTISEQISSSSSSLKPNAVELNKYKNYYTELKRIIENVPEDIASKSPQLVTLHKRLKLPEEFQLSVLSRCLTCRSSHLPSEISNPKFGSAFTNTVPTSNFFDNHGLNIFGKNLLTYHVTRKLMTKYPRLPTVVLNAAVDAYICEDVLAGIGKSWGIETEKTPVLERYLKKEPIQITLGKLRFYNNSLNQEDGIESISSLNFSEKSAYSLTIRSIIGALWACTQGTNPQYAFQFIDDHILSRKLDISKMFQFEQPTRELAALCRREELQRPVSRLLAESGRHSKAPVFIVGVFSGEEKLGEGFGSSLKEGKARAATDALMKWYCYEPLEDQHTVVDHGTVIV
ncbi:54S ribosomal protein L3 [Zygosaccharomyces mellis]|uniref:Large ribosomal subunit protein mL44 n=1 Tax=Zygosaccharomyces mellis TaxID=42258 RepID=A0A4C2EAA6_9SACH|nr:54S ribosomal protein L3 [Zygosaccharomyces mellis]